MDSCHRPQWYWHVPLLWVPGYIHICQQKMFKTHVINDPCYSDNIISIGNHTVYLLWMLKRHKIIRHCVKPWHASSAHSLVMSVLIGFAVATSIPNSYNHFSFCISVLSLGCQNNYQNMSSNVKQNILKFVISFQKWNKIMQKSRVIGNQGFYHSVVGYS